MDKSLILLLVLVFLVWLLLGNLAIPIIIAILAVVGLADNWAVAGGYLLWLGVLLWISHKTYRVWEINFPRL